MDASILNIVLAISRERFSLEIPVTSFHTKYKQNEPSSLTHGTKIRYYHTLQVTKRVYCQPYYYERQREMLSTERGRKTRDRSELGARRRARFNFHPGTSWTPPISGPLV
ncbi:uncharacterized protein LOC116851061 [Odontomachus brunneus]|uniref:uncharacterized protein LOC116851061 n=1 Tax=Odontomachus brunneus TaxID=486640 RepID=UPI0013F2913E|nr:uncharacterized protein LOC116851061 [Odontomachus brunneus]